ncbi:hypothetical protein [Emticicia fontis]
MKGLTADEQSKFRGLVVKVLEGEKFEMTPQQTRHIAIINFIKDLKDRRKTRKDVIDALIADFKKFGIASHTVAYIYYHEFINLYDQTSLFEQKEMLMSIQAENILEDRARELTKKDPDGKILAQHNRNMNALLLLYPKTPPIDYSKVVLPDLFFSFDPASLNTPVELDEKKLQKKLKKYHEHGKKHLSTKLNAIATDAEFEEIT